MKRKIPKRRAKYEMGLMTRLMHTIDPSYNIRFDFKPFILPELMPITHAQRTLLESKGIPVFPFGTREQCRDMRIAIIRHKNIEKKDMTYAEMKQTYEKIMNPPPAPAPTNASLMGTIELTAYANKHGVTIPVPPDKSVLKKSVQAHMDTNKSKAGGKKRTLKKRK